MSCFSCFVSRTKSFNTRRITSHDGSHRETPAMSETQTSKVSPVKAKLDAENGNIAAHSFTFRELAAATKNFQPECFLGEGGFGRVYKGHLENTSQVVAVKQLDRNGLLGHNEFLLEVSTLSLLHHPNIVNLIGYCADGDQRLLVYEFMPLGSLEDHLHGLQPNQKPLTWITRMKIATGVARGLLYLHEKANPPTIHRDLKSSNILLDGELNPKLTDFGLHKLGPVGDKMQATSKIMGTDGYSAPECARSGQLTVKSDVYSFGVVLLELISGRRAIDTTLPSNEQILVTWAQPIFKDQKRFQELVDPLLCGGFTIGGLNQAVAIAAMCLQEEATVRPQMADVVAALSFLSDPPSVPQIVDLRSKSPQSSPHLGMSGQPTNQDKSGDGNQVTHADSNDEAARSSSSSSLSDGDYIIMGH